MTDFNIPVSRLPPSWRQEADVISTAPGRIAEKYVPVASRSPDRSY